MKKVKFFKYCVDPKTGKPFAAESSGYADFVQENAISLDVIYEPHYFKKCTKWTATEKNTGIGISPECNTRKEAVIFVYHHIYEIDAKLTNDNNKSLIQKAYSAVQDAYSKR